MIAPNDIESRVEMLERELADVRRRLDRAEISGNWLNALVGSHEDNPDFDQVLELGRQIRAADRPSDMAGE
ncbi:MAG: transferase hexapeptide repeat containing protein [Phycisphaerae bacterium]|nr:hypothetical protein [Tepidisphaeraceae bacterium]